MKKELLSAAQERREFQDQLARNAQERQAKEEPYQQKTFTVGHLVELATQQPEYQKMIEESIIMAISNPLDQPESAKQIMESPDCVLSGEYKVKDPVATMKKRFRESGPDALLEFADTEISVAEIRRSMRKLKPESGSKEEQLFGTIMSKDWYEKISSFLLESADEKKPSFDERTAKETKKDEGHVAWLMRKIGLKK